MAAIERGVNEHEVGAIVRHGIAHPAVTSMVLQPVTHAGRHRVFDPLDRLTNPDVMRMVVDQVPEWFRMSDFVPVPCCFPTCRSMCYLLADGDGAIPFARLLDVEDYLDYVSNRVNPDPGLRHAVEKMFSSSAMPGAEQALLMCEACGIDLPAALKNLRENFFMIAVQDFQDPYTLNVRQLMKCCIEQITPDGRIIPFCAYNSVGYREQVRERLSGTQVAPVVPNARQLQPLLQPTRYGSKTVAGADGSGAGRAGTRSPRLRRPGRAPPVIEGGIRLPVLRRAIGAGACIAGAAAGYVLVVRGALTLDVGLGRRRRPLGPIRVSIAAPRETVLT